MRKAIAIDFDGCLCENAWPEIGAPHWDVIHAAQFAQRQGTALILWTCRSGELLEAARAWCRTHGMIFDVSNENLPERLEHYGCESRKVSADEYWDDNAVRKPDPLNDPLTEEQLREMDGAPVYLDLGDGGEWVLVRLMENEVYFTHKNTICVPGKIAFECGGKVYLFKPKSSSNAE